MRIQTIFRFKLGIRRVRGKEWASDRVGRENMSHHENLIDLMRTALKFLRGRLRRWAASGKVVTYIETCAEKFGAFDTSAYI